MSTYIPGDGDLVDVTIRGTWQWGRDGGAKVLIQHPAGPGPWAVARITLYGMHHITAEPVTTEPVITAVAS